MKKIIIGLTTVVLCLSFSNTIDYRDVYVGRFLCNQTCREVNYARSGFDVIKDTVTLVITKDVEDSILNIKLHNNVYKIKLKNNVMYPFSSKGHHSGKFYNADSLVFAYTANIKSGTCTLGGKRIRK